MPSKSGKLTSTQIETYMNKIPNFGGWYMRDDLPSPGKSIIVNTDVKTGGGIHWVAIHEDPRRIEYFDPFGMRPLPEAERYMKKSGKKMYYNNTQLQDRRSELCGWYCIYYLKERGKKRTPPEIFKDFTTTPSNDNENLVDGSGFQDFLNKFSLNEVISNLPIELHTIDQGDDGVIRKSNFTGPGTHFRDRVDLDDFGRITRIKTKPINKLDTAAMEHDRVYELYSDTDNRNVADYELLKQAKKIVRDQDSTFLQKANAVLVGMIMKTKIDRNI